MLLNIISSNHDNLIGRIIHLEGRPLINFGLCSYLGLEMHPRLKQGTIDAVLVIPTTALGHLTAIPTLIGENDAVIMDQQVHHSVQVAVEHVRAVGASVELLRHNDMQALEKRLNDLTLRYQLVWRKCQN